MTIYIFYPDKRVDVKAGVHSQDLPDGTYTYFPAMSYRKWDTIKGGAWIAQYDDQVPTWCRAYILLLEA